MAYIGQRVPRKEDYHILVGHSRYVGDIKLPGMLYAKVLRSPFAHARIKSIDTRAATALDGVVAVLTGQDIKDRIAYWGQIGTGWSVGDRRALTIDKVHFVGDEVAVVAAENPYAAMDALELIDVDYEELPVYVDPEKAMQDVLAYYGSSEGAFASYLQGAARDYVNMLKKNGKAEEAKAIEKKYQLEDRK